MKNLILSGLLLFGGIMISLRAHKTRGIILMLTLLLIVSATVFTNLYQIDLSKFSSNIEEYSELEPIQYHLEILTNDQVTNLSEQELKKIYKEMPAKKRSAEAQLVIAQDIRNPTDTDKVNLAKRLKEKTTLEANSKLISTAYSTRFADEGVDSSDQTCKIMLTKPPAPAFKKITGRFSPGVIDHIKFENESGIVSESGVSNDGKDFTFTCPNDTLIIAYDHNLENRVDGRRSDSSSIFGGIGPVYCSDGSRIKNFYGKTADQQIKKRPLDLGLSTYDYVLPKGFDGQSASTKDTLSGSIKGVSSDICGKVCTAMGGACNTTSFNGLDNTNGSCFFTSSTLNKDSIGVDIEDSRVYAKVPV